METKAVVKEVDGRKLVWACMDRVEIKTCTSIVTDNKTGALKLGNLELKTFYPFPAVALLDNLDAHNKVKSQGSLNCNQRSNFAGGDWHWDGKIFGAVDFERWINSSRKEVNVAIMDGGDSSIIVGTGFTCRVLSLIESVEAFRLLEMDPPSFFASGAQYCIEKDIDLLPHELQDHKRQVVLDKLKADFAKVTEPHEAFLKAYVDLCREHGLHIHKGGLRAAGPEVNGYARQEYAASRLKAFKQPSTKELDALVEKMDLGAAIDVPNAAKPKAQRRL